MIARFAVKQDCKSCVKYHNVVGPTDEDAKCKNLPFVSVFSRGTLTT